jgi:hypothetical protein
MDQMARDEITAAAAAHRELGPQYDDAVAESLVDRIGEEIDRRVDARLGRDSSSRAPRREPKARSADLEPRPPSRGNAAAVILALGSMGIGIGVAGTVLPLAQGGGGFWLVALVWVIIGVINVSYARRH